MKKTKFIKEYSEIKEIVFLTLLIFLCVITLGLFLIFYVIFFRSYFEYRKNYLNLKLLLKHIENNENWYDEISYYFDEYEIHILLINTEEKSKILYDYCGKYFVLRYVNRIQNMLYGSFVTFSKGYKDKDIQMKIMYNKVLRKIQKVVGE